MSLRTRQLGFRILFTSISHHCSIKNNITTSIAYIHMVDKPLTKMVHHTVNVTSTEAKLFAIRYSINQILHFNNISKIIVIIDFIYVAHKIFDSSAHPYQISLATILLDLHVFFNNHINNSIEFW